MNKQMPPACATLCLNSLDSVSMLVASPRTGGPKHYAVSTLIRLLLFKYSMGRRGCLLCLDFCTNKNVLGAPKLKLIEIMTLNYKKQTTSVICYCKEEAEKKIKICKHKNNSRPHHLESTLKLPCPFSKLRSSVHEKILCMDVLSALRYYQPIFTLECNIGKYQVFITDVCSVGSSISELASTQQGTFTSASLMTYNYNNTLDLWVANRG